VNHHSVAAI